MRLLIRLLLFNTFVIAALTVPDIGSASDAIYRLDGENGLAFMVRPAEKKGSYYWYIAQKRCTARLHARKVTITCPDLATMVAEEDADDVTVKVSGEVVGTYADGSVMYGMYHSIIRHAYGP